MKALKLLLASFILFGFALSSSAQSVTYKGEGSWEIWAACDGVWDQIMGPIDVHQVAHFNPNTGDLEWVLISFVSDALVSTNTGEVFSINFYRKIQIDPNENVYVTRFNLRGDEGSHILVTKFWHFDKSTGIWTETDETKCL